MKLQGPGTYESLVAVSPKGEYKLSKFHNSGATVINPKSIRFNSYGFNLYF
jgi:hypothetical protein